MFTKLKLTNFRKHADREIDFTSGLNVLRGNNEHGKTTVAEAISYALFGVTALRTSLDEAVTYGKSAASLRVELHMVIDGVDYCITRAKSGAEIRYADQHVTGQTETKLYMERVLGTTAQLASRLIFANQTDIRGVLSQGTAAASTLIESLANLSVLETMIESIQDQLPCGNTNALAAQLAALKAAPDEVPAQPDDSLVVQAQAAVTQQEATLATAQSNLDSLEAQASEARALLNTAARIEASNLKASRRRVELESVAAPTQPDVTEEQVEALIAATANEAAQRELYAASQITFPDVVRFQGTVAQYKEYKAKAQARYAELDEQFRTLRTQEDVTEERRINGGICPTCRTDLGKTASAKAHNQAIEAELERIDDDIQRVSDLRREAGLLLGECKVFEEDDAMLRKKMGRFWEAGDTMPVTPVWPHGPVQSPADSQAALRQARAELNAYRQAHAAWQAAQTELAGLVIEPVPDTTAATVAIAASEAAAVLVEDHRKTLHSAQVALETARGDYRAAMATYNAAVLAAQTRQQMLEQTQTMLDDMVKHNELVKKLRLARPVIANKLWTTVLGTVGHYFSAIRGYRSVVTRDNDGFKVDGQGVAGLSGSTLDALGMALRLALVKTFVPTASFLTLDEPAAACDSTRELAMLGTIASAGFDQTLLVTHSDLADSFATQVIQL